MKVLKQCVIAGKSYKPGDTIPEELADKVTMPGVIEGVGPEEAADNEKASIDEQVPSKVADVLAWVEEDPDKSRQRAGQAMEVEQARGDKSRDSLTDALAEILEG